MTAEFIALAFGALGALLGAAIQYRVDRYAKDEAERREIVSTHLLQLQNALESLFYRIRNLREQGGGALMGDGYYRDTTVYVIGRVLAHARLLVDEGIYARLWRDRTLRVQLKTLLHRIDWALDDARLLHYHRVEWAEMLLEDRRVLGYAEYVARRTEPAWVPAVGRVERFVAEVAPERLDRVGAAAQALVSRLEAFTTVPSALTLAHDRAP